MPDFQSQRNALNEKRAEQETARLRLFSAEEQLKLLRREQSALERGKNDHNAGYLSRKKAVDAKIETLEAQVKEQRIGLEAVQATLGALFVDFESLTDPREQLPEHFSSSTPFLLLPLRLETRFKTVTNRAGAVQPQLWVRIYPDTCLVDSFDPLLSTQELKNTARFWAEYYAAGEIVDESNPDPLTLSRQKAAWGLLVNLHGAGRAAWLAQSEAAKPQPGSVFPLRSSEKTVILTIATENTAILANQAAIFNFFKDLWLADRNAATIQQIKDNFPDAEAVIEQYQPVNFDEALPAGLSKADADLQIALVLLPNAEEATGKSSSWSQAAKVNVLPERFVLLGYKGDANILKELGRVIPSPLQVGFDPNAPEENRFSPTESGDLNIPEELKWIVDFDKAVEQGMGFRVDLDENMQAGFDRLFVLGVRLSADETEKGGQAMVQELFDHHFYSTKGLQIIPQGTPTNNTDSDSAAFNPFDNPDETFDRYFKQKPAFSKTGDWQEKQDGQWLSEWLGLDDTLFQKVLHAEGLDQADALNMNLALWHGTLGYAMDAMMQPVFNADSIAYTQQFFSMFVTGRGAVPAIRIGNQPYGILQTTAFNRLQWMSPSDDLGEIGYIGTKFFRGRSEGSQYLQRLYETLLKIQEDWTNTFVPLVSHVSSNRPDSTHQELLNIVGLHPNSVEFYFRYLQSLEMLYSYMIFWLPYNEVRMGFDKMEFGTAYELLKHLGYQESDDNRALTFPLLSKLYGLDDNWEHKVVIDTVPLSESAAIRGYTNDGKNYITALIRAANKSLDAVRNNTELKETPAALLYSFLKFSLEQGYFDTAVRLHETAEIFSPQQARFVREEQPFVHMNWQNTMVESRYALLYKNDDRIANGALVAQYISDLTRDPLELLQIAPGFAQQMNALKYLEGASTARLERAFVEHVDCCSYRLDAWQQGLLRVQLTLMRNNLPQRDNQEEAPPPRKGLYLGAFGWLENVQPETDKILQPKVLTDDIKKDFTENYVTDEANAGYIHAPSVNHAVTAAVLRNAFLTNGKTDNNNTLAVNLSSDRIRLALSVIEGIQNGQSLAALLGYKFERMLRDQDDLVGKGVDVYIYALRRVFPLNADQIEDTKLENDPSVDPDTVPISAIEASNVVHGKNLVDHVKSITSAANKTYPFGLWNRNLPVGNTDIEQAITAAVNFIMNIEDAVADLAMAESVHQVCMGNYDRAAGVLETYSSGNYPQMPDVISTPRSGPTLTQRVGIPLDFVASVAFDPLHPRRSAEPSLDQWLTTMLPPLSNIVCICKYTDRTDNSVQEDPVSLADLNLSALDLLYLLQTNGQAALTELDERFFHYIDQNKTPRLDTDIVLAYTQRPADPDLFPVFEILSFVKSLRALVLQSPNLKPTDITLMSEADRKTPLAVTLDKTRIDAVTAHLDGTLNDLTNNVIWNVLNPLPAEPSQPESDAIVQNIDTYLNGMVAQLEQLGRFGLPQTGFGNLYRWRQEIIAGMYRKIQTVLDRWKQKNDEYIDLETVFDNTAADATAQLQKMERLISTVYTPADTIDLTTVQGKKAQFDAKLAALNGLKNPNSITSIAGFYNDIQTEIATLGNFDLVPLDLSEEAGRIVRFVLDDLKPRGKGLYDLLHERNEKAKTLLTDYNSQNSEAQAKMVEAAAKVIFGDEFRMIPRYEVPAAQRFELNNAWNSTALLNYAKTVYEPPYANPAEDWLHGVARVREKLHHAENCLFLREAFELANTDLGIHPVQLPFQTEDYHWLAMPFPSGIDFHKGDHLLYTAFAPGNAPAPEYACGLLIDEWTEVIPTEKETTGLSFHYDRPNSEAPQTMLLVTPPKMTGNWAWEDLVDALHHSLDAAKLRAVEPAQIDQTAYARYLPPLVSPVAWHPIIIGMYMADVSLAAE